MITLNGRQFLEPGETADGKEGVVGTARRYMRQIKLFNMSGALIGVINGHGVLARATPLEDGRVWYSYATIPEVGVYANYSQSRAEIEALAYDRTYCAKARDYQYSFKRTAHV